MRNVRMMRMMRMMRMVAVRSVAVRSVAVRRVAVRRRPRPAIPAVGAETAVRILGSESAVIAVTVIGIIARI